MTVLRPRLLIGLGALALACGAGSALGDDHDKGGKKTVNCALVLFSSAEEHGGRFDAAFSAARTTDLKISVLFLEDYEGKHTLELKLFTPSGYLYQSLAVPAVLAEDDDKEEHLHDYPNPVKTTVLRKVKYRGQEYWEADLAFPVGGTAITMNSIYGVWTTQPFMDGSTTPCAAPTPVVIRQ